MDALAFERWFHDDEEVNPRIEMVQDVVDDMPEPYRTYIEETWYERLSRREMARRHGWSNPWYAQQAVEAAQQLFADIWTRRYPHEFEKGNDDGE